MKIKTIKYAVTSADVDPGKFYKPFSLMCDAQEVSNLHAAAIGFGYDDLIRKNCVWVLSRLRIRYMEPPVWGQEIALSTWHKGREGAFCFRDYEVNDAKDGRTLILATSSWLILDLSSRRMLRPDRVLGDVGLSTANMQDAIAEHCDKLTAPEDITFVRQHAVQYSDIDFNGHVNNAKYVEWALDCLDPDFLLQSQMEEYQINFNHEARLGDSVDLLHAQTSENSHFIEGVIGKTTIFQIYLKFKHTERGIASI